jgi:membrane-associated phospholipid phosphatase
LLCAVALAVRCTTAAAQTVASEQGPPVCEGCGFGKTVLFDTREVFTEPVRWQKPDWRSAGIKAAIVAASIAWLDEPVRDYVQDHKGATTERIANAFEPFGAEYALGALAGFALVGKFASKPKALDVALDGTVSSLIASGVVTPTLKAVVGRSRPREQRGPHDFDPFGGAASFPSGHTTEAFALAASIAGHYDERWVKALCYGVAGLVGYARMEHDEHWLSDVAAGAFIGIGVAHEVGELRRARRSLNVTPVRMHGGWGVSVSATF